MMKETGWDDFQLFFHVASEGGLSGAADRTGLSAPTIGRRMLALERALGRALFVRSQQGYQLAPDGEVLVEHVRTMRKAADSIADWHRHAFALPIVSIASDSWLSGFIADHVVQVRGSGDEFRLCCNAAQATLDMTFLAADIAVLGARPNAGNLAALRSVTTAYAVYRAANLTERADFPWISVATRDAQTPAEKWVFQNHEAHIFTWTASPAILPRLIRAGAGRGVLPAFLGDCDQDLIREGDIIETLSHPLWIVANADDRHRPEIRMAIDHLAALFKREEKRFAGTA